MLNVPSLFLYLDFFAPLTFLFMIIFLSFLLVKLLFKELTYKFLVDYLAKNRILKIKNIKFVDLFLNNVNSKGFSFFRNLGLLNNIYFKSLNFNSVVVLIFFIFLLF